MPPISTSGRLKAPQRRLAGALGHWAFGPLSPPLLCIGGRGSYFYPALPILGPSLPHQTLPTCTLPQKSFQVLFEREKRQKGKKSETVLFQTLNSMALASLSSHDSTLRPSSLVLGFSLNLFFCVFFPFSLYLLLLTVLSPLTAFSSQAFGIFSVLWLHL